MGVGIRLRDWMGARVRSVGREQSKRRPPPSAGRGHLPRRPGGGEETRLAGGEKTRLAEDGQAVAPREEKARLRRGRRVGVPVLVEVGQAGHAEDSEGGYLM